MDDMTLARFKTFLDELKELPGGASWISRRVLKSEWSDAVKRLQLKHNVSVKEACAIIYHDKDPEDLICDLGQKLPLKDLLSGWRGFCGNANKCECNLKSIEYRQNNRSGEEIAVSNAKREKTCLRNHGYRNVGLVPEKQKKTANTNYKRYGYKSPPENPDIQAKISSTCQKNHGVPWPMISPAIQAKSVITHRNNTGYDYPIHNPVSLAKMEATMIRLFGFRNAALVPKLISKKTTTCQIIYGFDNAGQSKIVQDKRAATNILRYETRHASQNPGIKSKIINTRRRIFYENLNLRAPGVSPFFTFPEYIGVDKKYEWQCDDCNFIFVAPLWDGKTPTCRRCQSKKGRSKSERELFDFLSSLQVVFQQNTKTIIPPLELDFYLSEFNLAIEFDGFFWHCDASGKDENYHLEKTKRCQDKGIQLIHIFENEWLTQQDIVKSRLKHLLGKTSKKIYARKCMIKEIPTSLCSTFLLANHLQGTVGSKIKLGLFHERELVGVMTFGKPRFTKKYDWELIRYATKADTSIIGGASKLFAYFDKKFKPKTIVSYADNRYSTGELYKALGFRFEHLSKPNYWYFKDSFLLHSRIAFQKHTLQSKLEIFDPSLTEWENMKNNGWSRIFDCGNHVFVR